MARTTIALCTFEGCGKPHYAKGYCKGCYLRFWRKGTPSRTKKEYAPRGSGHIVQGYRHIRVNGRVIMEHRHIMEQQLGRSLNADEVVHHKNHDTLDNQAVNLELLSRSAHLKLHWKLRKG